MQQPVSGYPGGSRPGSGYPCQPQQMGGYPGAQPQQMGGYPAGQPQQMGGYPAGQPQQMGGYPAAAVSSGISPEVQQWFNAVDGDRSGRISAKELKAALINGQGKNFSDTACQLMIG